MYIQYHCFLKWNNKTPINLFESHDLQKQQSFA